jgi:hypothetical protein
VKKRATVRCWTQVANYLEDKRDATAQELLRRLDTLGRWDDAGFTDMTVALTEGEWAVMQPALEEHSLHGEFQDVGGGHGG